jgi:hypothetical protein
MQMADGQMGSFVIRHSRQLRTWYRIMYHVSLTLMTAKREKSRVLFRPSSPRRSSPLQFHRPIAIAHRHPIPIAVAVGKTASSIINHHLSLSSRADR